MFAELESFFSSPRAFSKPMRTTYFIVLIIAASVVIY